MKTKNIKNNITSNVTPHTDDICNALCKSSMSKFSYGIYTNIEDRVWGTFLTRFQFITTEIEMNIIG